MILLVVGGYLIDVFQEIASLSAEPCEEGTIIVTVFDIKKSEVYVSSCSLHFQWE